jgi:hypothetical protein
MVFTSGQGFALEVFHDQALGLIPLAGMPDKGIAVADEVRIGQAFEQGGLGLEPLAGLIVVRRHAQDLEGHDFAAGDRTAGGIRAAGLENLALGAIPDDLEEFILADPFFERIIHGAGKQTLGLFNGSRFRVHG